MSTVESIRDRGATLADRVHQQVTDEDRGIINVKPAPWPAVGEHEAFDRVYGARNGDDMLDARDWGLMLGVAFTLARVDDPFALDAEIGARAYLAASEAWDRWTNPAYVQRVVAAQDAAERVERLLSGRPDTDDEAN